MNRYWDKTEKERSELTAQDVESYLAVEMMEKGVKKLEEPVLLTIEPAPKPSTRYYEVSFDGTYGRPDSSDFCFETMEQAQSFINSSPYKIVNDYGTETKHAAACTGGAITPVEKYSPADVARYKSILEKNKSAKSSNEKVMSAYNAAHKAVTQAVEGVWDDYRECCSKRRECEEVKRTWDEYVTLCGGDEKIASTFLRKAYDSERITDAENWFSESFGTCLEVCEALPL